METWTTPSQLECGKKAQKEENPSNYAKVQSVLQITNWYLTNS